MKADSGGLKDSLSNVFEVEVDEAVQGGVHREDCGVVSQVRAGAKQFF